MKLTFLRLDEVLLIHRDQLDRYGGATGIRDIGLLQSALATPEAGIKDRYLHRDVFEMAAAYLFHITSNHPFVDGNKRVGAVTALVFLAMNNVVVDVDEDALERVVRSVAEGVTSKAQVADFLRRAASG